MGPDLHLPVGPQQPASLGYKIHSERVARVGFMVGLWLSESFKFPMELGVGVPYPAEGSCPQLWFPSIPRIPKLKNKIFNAFIPTSRLEATRNFSAWLNPNSWNLITTLERLKPFKDKKVSNNLSDYIWEEFNKNTAYDENKAFDTYKL